MTNSQKLQIKMSETRDLANNETTTPEDRTRLLGELKELEKQFRSAVEGEAAETADAFTGSWASGSGIPRATGSHPPG